MILKFDGKKLSVSPYGKDYRCPRIIYPLFSNYNLHLTCQNLLSYNYQVKSYSIKVILPN